MGTEIIQDIRSKSLLILAFIPSFSLSLHLPFRQIHFSPDAAPPSLSPSLMSAIALDAVRLDAR